MLLKVVDQEIISLETALKIYRRDFEGMKKEKGKIEFLNIYYFVKTINAIEAYLIELETVDNSETKELETNLDSELIS